MQLQRLSLVMRHLLLAQRVPPPPQQLASLSLTFQRYLDRSYSQSSQSAGVDPVSKDKLKKPLQKITLIAQNESLSITTLEEAQKLAKRRDLHLLRLQQTDAKSGRAMFKLVTAAEMLDDDRKSNKPTEKTQNKSEKSLTIGARITDHDLSSRLKNIIKWLGKRHEVRILIQGSSSGAEDAERIVKTIEQTIKEPQLMGKIVQKRSKGSMIRFSILPVAVEPPSTTA